MAILHHVLSNLIIVWDMVIPSHAVSQNGCTWTYERLECMMKHTTRRPRDKLNDIKWRIIPDFMHWLQKWVIVLNCASWRTNSMIRHSTIARCQHPCLRHCSSLYSPQSTGVTVKYGEEGINRATVSERQMLRNCETERRGVRCKIVFSRSDGWKPAL